MDNLIQLPERPVLEWQAMRKILADLMREKGHDDDAIEHVSQRLRPVFMNLLAEKASSPLITTPDEAVAFVNAFFSRVSAGLLMELANLAIENYQLQNGS